MMGGSHQGGSYQTGSYQTGQGSDSSGVQIPNFEPEYRSFDVSQDLGGQSGGSGQTSTSSRLYNSRPDNSYPSYSSSNTHGTQDSNRQFVYTAGGSGVNPNYYPDNTGSGSTIYRGGSSSYYPSGSGSVVYPINRGRATAPNTGVMSSDPVIICLRFCIMN